MTPRRQSSSASSCRAPASIREVGAEGEDDPLIVLVPEDSLEAAQDAIEALSEPDDLLAEP